MSTPSSEAEDRLAVVKSLRNAHTIERKRKQIDRRRSAASIAVQRRVTQPDE